MSSAQTAPAMEDLNHEEWDLLTRLSHTADAIERTISQNGVKCRAYGPNGETKFEIHMKTWVLEHLSRLYEEEAEMKACWQRGELLKWQEAYSNYWIKRFNVRGTYTNVTCAQGHYHNSMVY